jgi:hypothetical protein
MEFEEDKLMSAVGGTHLPIFKYATINNLFKG